MNLYINQHNALNLFIFNNSAEPPFRKVYYHFTDVAKLARQSLFQPGYKAPCNRLADGISTYHRYKRLGISSPVGCR